jgi:2-phospho-L-lactate/phosphoenolpyruvate guanylyltransferase
MRTAAILPVKRFPLAKKRLGESVEDSLRGELAKAMVGDVLCALRECEAIEATIVVTCERTVALAATYIGAIVVEDTAEEGQSAAALLGLARALAEGFERALCVPGDCPTLDPAELAELLAPTPDQTRPNGEATPPARTRSTLKRANTTTPEREVTIVPDRHGNGTNGLLLRPPDAIAPSFGPDSCARHERLAEERGANCAVARPASLLLDIDTGEDLAVLRERLADTRAGARRTRAVLARAGGEGSEADRKTVEHSSSSSEAA